LHMRVMNGATVSQAFFSSHVGIGSRGHCLAGNLRISDVTSNPEFLQIFYSGSVDFGRRRDE